MTGSDPGATFQPVDTKPTVEARLLAEAEKQTTALEGIRFVANFMFVLGLLAAGLWVILLLAS